MPLVPEGRPGAASDQDVDPQTKKAIMIPVLPSNPSTIAPRSWPLETVDQCEERLDFLRKIDTLERATDELREAEKASIEHRIQTMKAGPSQAQTP